MAYGLQVFNSSGNITLDTNYRITRIVLEAYITLAYGVDNIVSVPGCVPNSNWSAQVQAYTPAASIDPRLVAIGVTLQNDSINIKTYGYGFTGSIYAKVLVYRV